MHSENYQKVKDYYESGLWDKRRVYNSVTNPKSNPWITSDEYEAIVGEPYEVIMSV